MISISKYRLLIENINISHPEVKKFLKLSRKINKTKVLSKKEYIELTHLIDYSEPVSDFIYNAEKTGIKLNSFLGALGLSAGALGGGLAGAYLGGPAGAIKGATGGGTLGGIGGYKWGKHMGETYGTTIN